MPIEQVSIDKDGGLHVIHGQGWFGVESLEEARTAKAATKRDVLAMRTYARNRSYRYLGGDNSIGDVSEFLDLAAASFWLKHAHTSGSVEAGLEFAYLEDLIAQQAARTKWLAKRGVRRSAIPPVVSELLRGTYVQGICAKARARMDVRNAMERARRSWSSDRMVYYLRQAKRIDQQLLAMADKPHMPRLSEAIRIYVVNEAKKDDV